MKKILTILLLLICSNTFAQKENAGIAEEFASMQKNFTESDNKWTFTKIVEVDGVSEQDIFTSLLSSLAYIYNDSKEVVQVADKDSGLIVAKGFTESDYRTVNAFYITKNRCWHSISINVKDGRYRVIIEVDDVMFIGGADLRGVVFTENDKYPLSTFYPYWKDCKPKHQEKSFANLRYAYNSAIGVMETIENRLADTVKKNNDNW